MLSFSVALDPNKGIGYKNTLPWHIKEELQIFKRNTLYKNIVMGRNTYESLPGKLKDRYITVISLNDNYHPEDVKVEHSLLNFLKEHENDEIEYVICGGASIYKVAYPYCKKAYVSFIKKEYETDTSFESFDLNDWNITKEEEYQEFTYRELEKKQWFEYHCFL